jgi:hypothetical protein
MMEKTPGLLEKFAWVFEHQRAQEIEHLGAFAAETLEISGPDSQYKYIWALSKLLADASEGVVVVYMLVTSPARYSLRYRGVATDVDTWDKIIARASQISATP